MKRTATINKKMAGVTAYFALLAVMGTTILLSACSKNKEMVQNAAVAEVMKKAAAAPLVQHQPITTTVTIANLRTNGSALRAMFCQNEELFTVTSPAVIAALQSAYSKKQAVQVTFDPWQAIVLQASAAPASSQPYFNTQETATRAGTALRISAATSDDVINHTADLAVINTTNAGLTGVIPDMATAQLMFDYIAHQCCQLPGPYGVSYCITFQYCEDGCYARASKMVEIINNNYHYATQKVFSFANAGNDELCVQAQKWNGCCINWWYHVAPLVTIKTTDGPKAYVFDPAMFDQPVTLATWLHFQANPACVPTGDVPHVSMINIQPNASFWPSTGTGYDFDTDPDDVEADYYLTSYRYLTSCP